jgi:hypothetical protein
MNAVGRGEKWLGGSLAYIAYSLTDHVRQRCLSCQAAYQARFMRPIQELFYSQNDVLNLYKLYAIPRLLLSNRIIRHKKTYTKVYDLHHHYD